MPTLFSSGHSTIDIPRAIVLKMRLNKNFANVYTPIHEMEPLEVDLALKRRQRMERRALERPVEWDQQTAPVKVPSESRMSFGAEGIDMFHEMRMVQPSEMRNTQFVPTNSSKKEMLNFDSMASEISIRRPNFKKKRKNNLKVPSIEDRQRIYREKLS